MNHVAERYGWGAGMPTVELAYAREQWQQLPERERRILRSRCEGVRIIDIGASLGRSPRYVQSITERALDCLGIDGPWRGRVAQCCYALGRMDASHAGD